MPTTLVAAAAADGAGPHGATLARETQGRRHRKLLRGRRVTAGAGVLHRRPGRGRPRASGPHQLIDLPSRDGHPGAARALHAVRRRRWPTVPPPPIRARRHPGAPGIRTPVARRHEGRVPRRRKVIDPDDRDFAVVPEAGRGPADVRNRVAPWCRPDALDVTTCLYGTLAENDFIIDRVGTVTVAAGFSGHGFKFVPLVGQLVADLVAGTSTAEPRFTRSQPINRNLRCDHVPCRQDDHHVRRQPRNRRGHRGPRGQGRCQCGTAREDHRAAPQAARHDLHRRRGDRGRRR